MSASRRTAPSDQELPSGRSQTTLHLRRGACGSALRSPPSALRVPALTLEFAKNGPILRGQGGREKWKERGSPLKCEESSKGREDAIQGKQERVRQRRVVASQPAHYQKVGISPGCCREGARQKLEEHAGDRVGQSSRQERRCGSRFFWRTPPRRGNGFGFKMEECEPPRRRIVRHDFDCESGACLLKLNTKTADKGQ